MKVTLDIYLHFVLSHYGQNKTENFKIKLFGDYISYGVKVQFFLWLASSL